MRTIGFKHRGPIRDHTSFCDICGVAWLRSELTGPDEDGYFRCPDDREGRATKELDYTRALNASEPSEVNGVRDRPGETPANLQLVGWGWAQAGSALKWGGGLQIARTAAGLYTVTGASFDTIDVFAFDATEPGTDAGTSSNIPRHYWAAAADGATGRVLGQNRIGGADSAVGAGGVNVGVGGFVVLAYKRTGGRGVLTEVASAWVNGATGAAYSSDGAITTVRTATGLYTITLTSGTLAVATVSRFSAADVSTLSAGFVWGGKVSSTQVRVRSLNTGGVETDNDFLVRCYL